MQNRKYPILSIIIPVYCVENYIGECLDSIVNQKEFVLCEVICVDDCSPDHSCSIIDRYVQQYDNIHLVRNVVNKKAGGARNHGIKVARGKYLWFVDGDDFISRNALSVILKEVDTYDLDVLCFNHSLWTSNCQSVEMAFQTLQPMKGTDFLKKNWGSTIIYNLGYPCRAIYKKQIIKDYDIRFLENTIYGEETTFMVEVIAHGSNVSSLCESLYFYRQNSLSSTALLEKAWRGQQIYESIFVAGNLIIERLGFIRKLDKKLYLDIMNGMPWFVNRLFIRMLRTNSVERKIFYESIKNNEILVKELVPFMNLQNKLISLYPFLSQRILPVLSLIYDIKRANAATAK